MHNWCLNRTENVAQKLHRKRWAIIATLKGNMNVYGNSQTGKKQGRVLSLFSQEELHSDPIQDLLDEAQSEAFSEEEVIIERRRDLVLENHFPDQSMHILERQVKDVKESLARIKFYLGELEDILPY